jgi:DNA invertase Pin-like site-specific DNA recombinase
MFGMLCVLAERQRELIVANTRDGLIAARARGRKGGRRPKLNPEQIALAQQLCDAGERTVQQIGDLQRPAHHGLRTSREVQQGEATRCSARGRGRLSARLGGRSAGDRRMAAGHAFLTSTPS